MTEISTFFVNFRLNQVRKENERQDIQLSIKKHYFYRTLTDNARHKNVSSPVDLTRILKSYHKKNDRSKFLEK